MALDAISRSSITPESPADYPLCGLPILAPSANSSMPLGLSKM